MELLNVGFAILLIKVTISVLPCVLGSYLLLCSVETKRKIRRTVCSRLFGVSNAIPYVKFVRFLHAVGPMLVVLGLLAGWFLLF